MTHSSPRRLRFYVMLVLIFVCYISSTVVVKRKQTERVVTEHLLLVLSTQHRLLHLHQQSLPVVLHVLPGRHQYVLDLLLVEGSLEGGEQLHLVGELFCVCETEGKYYLLLFLCFLLLNNHSFRQKESWLCWL